MKWPFAGAVILLLGVTVAPTLAGKPLIGRQSRWRFFDRGFANGGEGMRSWRRRDFDDSRWRHGSGVMGYGDSDVGTTLSFGDDPQRKPTAAFFRTRFRLRNVRRPGLFVGGRIRCDDGAAVFVNSHEVFRHNLPAGTVEHKTLAVVSVGPDATAERRSHPFQVPVTALREGENVVAVSVHQATSTSSDLAMSMELFETVTEEEAAAFRSEIDKSQAVTAPVAGVKVRVGPMARLNKVNE